MDELKHLLSLSDTVTIIPGIDTPRLKRRGFFFHPADLLMTIAVHK
jgi:hypothetical protein